MRKIIIDFDHTLFNAQAFKEDLAKSLGLSLLEWEKDYQQNKKLYKNYNYKKQLAKFPKSKQQNFLAVLKNSKKYLYNDAIKFLQRIVEVYNYKPLLLSKGEPEFQKIKIKNSGLKKYLKVKTAAKSKFNFIKALKGKSEIIFINDRGSEIDEIKKKFPQITTIWIRRTNGQYKNEPCKLFDKKRINLKIKL